MNACGRHGRAECDCDLDEVAEEEEDAGPQPHEEAEWEPEVLDEYNATHTTDY